MIQMLSNHGKPVALAVLLAVASVAAAGCNTTRGFGQDVKETGRAIEESVDGDKSRR